MLVGSKRPCEFYNNGDGRNVERDEEEIALANELQNFNGRHLNSPNI